MILLEVWRAGGVLWSSCSTLLLQLVQHVVLEQYTSHGVLSLTSLMVFSLSEGQHALNGNVDTPCGVRMHRPLYACNTSVAPRLHHDCTTIEPTIAPTIEPMICGILACA